METLWLLFWLHLHRHRLSSDLKVFFIDESLAQEALQVARYNKGPTITSREISRRRCAPSCPVSWRSTPSLKVLRQLSNSPALYYVRIPTLNLN
ncbi:hypothetical protein U1Q18_039680 [Sarracenia purpurea var. burkii]